MSQCSVAHLFSLSYFCLLLLYCLFTPFSSVHLTQLFPTLLSYNQKSITYRINCNIKTSSLSVSSDINNFVEGSVYCLLVKYKILRNLKFQTINFQLQKILLIGHVRKYEKYFFWHSKQVLFCSFYRQKLKIAAEQKNIL